MHCGTGCKAKIYMMSCQSCHIYGIWTCKEVGTGRFKVMLSAFQSQVLLGIAKAFIGYLFSIYYCYFTCFLPIEIFYGNIDNLAACQILLVVYSVAKCEKAYAHRGLTSKNRKNGETRSSIRNVLKLPPRD